MRTLINLLATASFLLSFSCSDTGQDCCVGVEGGVELSGDWRVYEQGYSPGTGYVVEEVPADPAQIMSFGANNAFSSNIEGLEAFTHYLTLDDPHSDGKILALYTSEPDASEREISNLKHSYQIGFDNGNLRLSYRFCIEGCHMGLKKL